MVGVNVGVCVGVCVGVLVAPGVLVGVVGAEVGVRVGVGVQVIFTVGFRVIEGLMLTAGVISFSSSGVGVTSLVGVGDTFVSADCTSGLLPLRKNSMCANSASIMNAPLPIIIWCGYRLKNRLSR